MSAEADYEQLREQIWDHLFKNGQQSVQELSEQMQLSEPTVIGLVEHEWFVVEDQQVAIATSSD